MLRSSLKLLSGILLSLCLATNAVSKGQWQVETDKSAMDDSPTVVLSVRANAASADRLGKTIRPTLSIRCKENDTDVFINWQQFLTTGGSDDGTSVQYRIDAARAVTAPWSISTDFTATFSRNSVQLARKLATGRRLVVRTTPYGEDPVEASFNLDGLAPLLPRVAQACGWNTGQRSTGERPAFVATINDASPAQRAQLAEYIRTDGKPCGSVVTARREGELTTLTVRCANAEEPETALYSIDEVGVVTDVSGRVK